LEANVAEEETKQEEQFKTTTIGERGNYLPIGFKEPNGGLARAFSFRRWTMKQEKELGEVREKLNKASLPEYVMAILGLMTTNIGSIDIQSMKDAERQLVFGQMFMADVLYMYICLRLQALGNELDIELKCPSCGAKQTFTADVGSIDVRHIERPEMSCFVHTLRDPIRIRNKEVTKFQLGHSRWGALVTGGISNVSEAKSTIIAGSVIGINDEITDIMESELDDISKKDLEDLVQKINKAAVGPDMSVEGSCSATLKNGKPCKAEFKSQIDWGYDSFFAGSSR
jgi:hypothetical protein